MGTAKTVPLDRIKWSGPGRPVDKDHVRELADSIKQDGLLQRIGVVELPGEQYEGLFGRHRYEAMRSLGGKEIDVEVLDLDEVDRRIATIHENLKRLDLDPVQRAKAFKDYLDARRARDPEMLQKVVAAELQVSESELSNTLRILDQDVRVQKLLQDGQISAGHLEHAIGPLTDKLPKEQVVRFAHEIARRRSDVRTAKEEARRLLERRETELAAEAAIAAAKKAGAKVVSCPECEYGGGRTPPEKTFEAEGRLVLEHKFSYSREAHRWYGDTGEVYATPAERKDLERRMAEAAKLRKKTKREKREKVLRDYAVFFSRAPIDKWAQALLEAGKETLRRMTIGSTYGGTNWDINDERGGGLVVDATFKVPKPVRFSGVDLADGAKGKFLTRVQIGYYRSTPSEDDHVAEGSDVAKLRKLRGEVLAFQRKRVGVRQADGDLWPTGVGGFSRGEKVKIGASEWSSYVGKQGPILAFDVEDKDPVAVLDIAAAHKRHRVAGLKKIEATQKATKARKAKGAPKGRAKT